MEPATAMKRITGGNRKTPFVWYVLFSRAYSCGIISLRRGDRFWSLHVIIAIFCLKQKSSRSAARTAARRRYVPRMSASRTNTKTAGRNLSQNEGGTDGNPPLLHFSVLAWEESCCSYSGRSCRWQVGKSESRSNNEPQRVNRDYNTLFSRERLNNRMICFPC